MLFGINNTITEEDYNKRLAAINKEDLPMLERLKKIVALNELLKKNKKKNGMSISSINSAKQFNAKYDEISNNTNLSMVEKVRKLQELGKSFRYGIK